MTNKYHFFIQIGPCDATLYIQVNMSNIFINRDNIKLSLDFIRGKFGWGALNMEIAQIDVILSLNTQYFIL